MKYTHATMGRKPLGKDRYNITCPPKVMADFDAAVAAQGKTRSDVLADLMREYAKKHPASAPPKRK